MGNGPGWSRLEWVGAGRVVEILWAAARAEHRGENQSQTGPVGEFRPMVKSFLNSKQFEFESNLQF
jgi:hypothetical protein